MKSIKYLLWLTCMLPAVASAWQWMDLWQTPEQQGSKLLQAGKAQAAAQVFRDKNWIGVSHYRSGNYAQAFKQFNESKRSDGQYNAGNAAAFMGKYQDAIAAYDKAIAFNPANNDAITNREIIKKLLQQQDKNSSTSQKSDKGNSSSQQDNAKQNSGQKKQADKQQQSDQQKNSSAKSSQLSNNSKESQSNNARQQPNNQQKDVNATATASKQQRLDENNKQLLRRLADDPGGLLQNKFLRDYARRHGVDVDSNQGGNSS